MACNVFTVLYFSSSSRGRAISRGTSLRNGRSYWNFINRLNKYLHHLNGDTFGIVTFRRLSHRWLFSPYILRQSPSHPPFCVIHGDINFWPERSFSSGKGIQLERKPEFRRSFASVSGTERVRESARGGRPKARSAVASHNPKNLLLWSAALHCS